MGCEDAGPGEMTVPFDPFSEPAPDGDAVVAPAAASTDEREAAARRAMIEAGRRKGGVAGAVLAGSMLALREIYEGPPKDESAIEIEASSEPHDVDRDGVRLEVAGVDVGAPPLERRDPLPTPKHRR